MKKKQGFTLIELMIVVAIIGILAAVAIPAFLRFITKSKKSEAPINIKAIQHGAISWYNEEHNDTAGDPIARHFPSTNSPTGYNTVDGVDRNPDSPPCINSLSKGAMYVKNTQNWNKQPWLALKFSISKAHYFMYTYNGFGINQTAILYAGAGADLDCDNVYEVLESQGTVNATSGEIEMSNIYHVTGAGNEIH